ncbi:MAG: ATP-binding protein [Candidatus Hydrogenedentota bacterium]
METFRALVVDDEPGIRMAVSRVLKDYTVSVPDVDAQVRFEVDAVETGEEALARIDTDPPDLLLLDNKLPGISGMEVLERIAPMNLEMHVIIITAYASIETAVRATKEGAFDFLPKPFTPTDLKNTLNKTIRHFLVARQARSLAAEKRRLRFQFISVLAHELKAPLNAVEGYLKILADPKRLADTGRAHDIIGRCLTRTGYMRKMIVDLLDLTRIESGERPRELGACNVTEAAQAAADTLLPDAQKRGIAVHVHADDEVPLHADPAELAIIFNNLVSNAIKYNRDGGRVDVTIAREDDQVRAQVQDTGIGLSEEEAATLFRDFVRIKNEKTKDILGSGLGLSTVKKLALMYGGDITVSSVPDAGSTFTITLKDAQPAAPERASAAHSTHA